MAKSNEKVKVAAWSVASNTALIIMKIIAGIMSGSVSIVSEAIHSGMDLLAALIAFFSVKFASKPADDDHPYGHGKIENVSGVVEGILIFAAAFFIVIEAIKKLIYPTKIEDTMVAIGVMLISAYVNWVIAGKLYKVARAEESVALEADALHHKTDVYTSLGVAIGLILIRLTGITILDPIVAILVAGLIIKESWQLCLNAFSPLIDAKLSDAEETRIKEVLEKYKDEIADFHQLRTRKSGQFKYIDFHMTVNDSLTVKQSHQLCERIEGDLEENLKHTNVNIHVEPLEEEPPPENDSKQYASMVN